MKRVVEMALLISIALFISGCAALLTPVGPISTGMTAWGALEKGELYQDPLGRFSLIAPENNLRPNRTDQGVILNNVDFGSFEHGNSYVVFAYAYDLARDIQPNETPLSQTLQGIQWMFEQQRFKVTVLEQRPRKYRGYSALDFQLFLEDARGDTPDRIYVSRLVNIGSVVYWMYASRHSFVGKEMANKYIVSDAEVFFDGVSFR